MAEQPTLAISFDEGTINEQIANAILNSYLGKQFKEDLQRALSGAIRGSYGKESVIQTAVAEAVRGLVMKELADRKAAITELVRQQLTDQLIKEKIGDFVQSVQFVSNL